MAYPNDPKEAEYLDAIKKAEKTNIWFIWVAILAYPIGLWLAGYNLGDGPKITAEVMFLMMLLLMMVCLGSELLSVKILMHKAEYREWLREFRPVL
jgi:hypothetical protein